MDSPGRYRRASAHMAVAVLLAAALAGAQQPPRPAAALPALPELEKASSVPDAEKLTRSSKALGTMREALREVLARLEEARRARDVVQLNCANEKLTQVKGLLRIAEQADVALQEALARKESSAAEREYSRVMIARQKVSQLRAETEACLGELAFRTDENLLVEVEEPEGLSKDDPSRPPPPTTPIIRPPAASPQL